MPENWGFSMRPLTTSLKYVFLAGLLFAGSTAWSDCACFCVEGELQTLCTTVDEAQDRPTLCPTADSATCPQDSGAASASTYDAPDDEAINCRSVRVYDAIRGAYVNARACNVI